MSGRWSLFTISSICLCVLGCGAHESRPVEPASSYDLVQSSPGGTTTIRGRVFVMEASREGRKPTLILVHDDHGLTEWELAQADRLAHAGYLVFAIDLYEGKKVDNVMDAHILDRGLPEEQALAQLKVAVDFMVQHPRSRGDRIGIIGWGMGGGYALDAARNDPRLRACVVCYGRVATDPGSLTSMKAAVLGVFAGKDEGISEETVSAFSRALASAGKKGTLKRFPDSKHGFMNPADPGNSGQEDSKATASAWETIDGFLAAELKTP
jgi:carboxymethylenebutenolidase